MTAALSGKRCVAIEEIQLSSALDYGGLAVLRDGWQRFGMDKLLDTLSPSASGKPECFDAVESRG